MKRLLKKGVLLSLCKALETALGFAFAVLMLWKFGAGADTDALFGATVLSVGIFNMIPNMISQVLIPTLIAPDYPEERRRKFLGSICWLCLVVGIIFFVLSLVAPRVLLAVSSPGLEGESQKLALRYTMALAPLYVCTLIFGLVQGMLHAERRFFGVETAQLIWKVAPVVAILGSGTFGLKAVVMSYTVAAIFRLVLVVHVLGLRRLEEIVPCIPRKQYFPSQCTRLMGTEGILVIVDWGTEILIRALASMLPVGGLSVFNYAERFCRSLPGTVLRGFGVVLLPDMARLTALGGSEERSFITQICAISIAAGGIAGILLYNLAPVIVLFFSNYADIDSNALLNMETSIQFFSPYILFLLLVMILQARFFLQGQNKSILVLSIIHATTLLLILLIAGGNSPQDLSLAMTAAIAVKGFASWVITNRQLVGSV